MSAASSRLDMRGGLRVTARDFWVARFARIYPAYLAAFCVAAIPIALVHCPARKCAVAGVSSIALVQAWIPQVANVWNPPGWSLSAEAFFYAAFPLFAVPLVTLRTDQLV